METLQEFVAQHEREAVYHSIACVCGSRHTKRIGDRLYQCQDCGTDAKPTNLMLFCGRDGLYVLPMMVGREVELAKSADEAAA